MKHLLISCFWTLWYSLQPWDDWGSKLISLIHFCSTCKKARCHLLSVSSTDDLSILSSSWVSSGATFLTAEAVGESSLVVCFSHWAGGENADFSTDIFQLCWMKVTKKIQELYELSTFIILWPSWRSIDIYLYYIYNIIYIYIMYIYIYTVDGGRRQSVLLPWTVVGSTIQFWDQWFGTEDFVASNLLDSHFTLW